MITLSAVNLIIGIFTIFGFVFAIYLYFKNPQIKTDNAITEIKDEIRMLSKAIKDTDEKHSKEIFEIKETHLRQVENDLRNLGAAVASLDKTVVRLTTIIDERIPKGSPGLTAPGT